MNFWPLTCQTAAQEYLGILYSHQHFLKFYNTNGLKVLGYKKVLLKLVGFMQNFIITSHICTESILGKLKTRLSTCFHDKIKDNLKINE